MLVSSGRQSGRLRRRLSRLCALCPYSTLLRQMTKQSSRPATVTAIGLGDYWLVANCCSRTHHQHQCRQWHSERAAGERRQAGREAVSIKSKQVAGGRNVGPIKVSSTCRDERTCVFGRHRHKHSLGARFGATDRQWPTPTVNTSTPEEPSPSTTVQQRYKSIK